MSEESLQEISTEDRTIVVCEIPEMTEVLSLSLKQLLAVLKTCPASEYFGCREVKLNAEIKVNKNQARKLVIEMIKQFQMQFVETISEKPSSQEQDIARNNHGIDDQRSANQFVIKKQGENFAAQMRSVNQVLVAEEEQVDIIERLKKDLRVPSD